MVAFTQINHNILGTSIRIHLRTSKSLLQEWNIAAKKHGSTKSKLLNQWLGNPIQNLAVVPSSHKTNNVDLKQISLRLPLDRVELLKELANKWQLSLNQLLERIIYTQVSNVTKTLPGTPINDRRQSQITQHIEELWLQGRNSQILEQYAFNAKLNSDIQVRLSRISMQQSELQLAIELMNKAEEQLVCKDINLENVYAELNLAKAQWWRMKANYKAANHTLNAVLTNHRNLTAHQYCHIYHQLSTLNEIMGDFKQAAKFTWVAMEYMRVDTHISSYVKSYLRLASLHAADSPDLARQFMARAEELSSRHNLGIFMQAYLLNRKGLILLRLAEVLPALHIFRLAHTVATQHQLKLERCYSLEGMLACSDSIDILSTALIAFRRDFPHRLKLQRLIEFRQNLNPKQSPPQFNLPLNIQTAITSYNFYHHGRVVAV